MVNLEGENKNPNDRVEKYIYGNIAWTLLTEMWEQNKVIVPGREKAWEGISKIAERRPTTDINSAPAERLLDRHTAAGHSNIIFKEKAGGIQIPLEIDEGVFNPEFTKASRLLLSVVTLTELKDKKFLDAFSGSGVLGIYAAARGADVVAYDSSKAAVQCATNNIQRHDLTDKMAVRLGDRTCLQEGEQFDVIAANPPLLPLPLLNNQPLASAVFDPEAHATIDFIEGLPLHLTSQGECYLLTSSTFDKEERNIYALCEQNQLKAQLVAVAPREYEWYRIHQIRRGNQ